MNSANETENEAIALACIERALGDKWQDGKSRKRLQRVMAERVSNMRRLTGYQTLPALRAGDRATFVRFLAGSMRAMRRDGLIETGHLGSAALARLRERFETRDLHAAFDEMHDPAENEADPNAVDRSPAPADLMERLAAALRWPGEETRAKESERTRRSVSGDELERLIARDEEVATPVDDESERDLERLAIRDEEMSDVVYPDSAAGGETRPAGGDSGVAWDRGKL